MMRLTFAALLATSLLATWLGNARAADWPQWGGGPQRNMVADESGLPDDFHPGRKKRDRLGFDPATSRNVRFIARLGTENYSSPVVAGGRVYIGTNDEDIDDPRLEPTRGGVLLCLDERTGAVVWRLVVPRLEIDRSKVSEDFDDMNLGICSAAGSTSRSGRIRSTARAAGRSPASTSKTAAASAARASAGTTRASAGRCRPTGRSSSGRGRG